MENTHRLSPHLAAIIIVGHIQSEERLHAWRSRGAVLQEEPMLLCAEEGHHQHIHLSERKPSYFLTTP